MRVEEESAEAIVARSAGNRVERRPKNHETGHFQQLFMDSPGVFRNGRTLPWRQLTGPVVERKAGGFRQEAIRGRRAGP